MELVQFLCFWHRKRKKLKADGYGHGAVPIAKEIEDYSYIWGIAVATVEEGRELRKAGIRKPILILGYTYEEDYDRIVKEDFQPTVFKLSMAEQLSKAAVKANKTLKIHIKLDTGMTRIGYRHIEDAIPEIVEINVPTGNLCKAPTAPDRWSSSKWEIST